MKPLDRSYTTYLPLVELFDVEYYRDLEMWVTTYRSLKVIENGTMHLKAWKRFTSRHTMLNISEMAKDTAILWLYL